MLLKEPVSPDRKLLAIKQESMTRALLAARKAMADGTLRTLERPANFSYERKLRVSSK